MNPQLYEWLRIIDAKSASSDKVSQPDPGVKQYSARYEWEDEPIALLEYTEQEERDHIS